MNFDEYRAFDATALASLVRKREIRPGELLELAKGRAEEVDGELNILTVDDMDLAERRLKAELKGPFAGVPFLFKDLYCYLQDTVFTNGSHLVGEFRANSTSTFVQRCLVTGLVPFGKTSSPEFGVNVVTESQRFGPCRNPWNKACSPGGSSGGSAAAVASGIVPMAHASDGGGSIRIPASACGLFGLKPSRARTPVGPFVGEAWNGLACGFVVSRSVRDSASMLDLLSGGEAGDPYACPAPTLPFLQAIQTPPVPQRIGLWLETPTGSELHPDCRAATQATAQLLEEIGHRVEPVEIAIDAKAIIDANLTVISVNLANDLDFWRAANGSNSGRPNVERITMALAERGRTHTGTEFASALMRIHGLGRKFGQVFDKFDVLLTPTLGTPPLTIGTIDQNSDDLETYLARTVEHIPFTPLYNMTGCPAISVPLWWNEGGMPIGSMLGAALGEEGRLLQIARQLEEARPWFNRLP